MTDQPTPTADNEDAPASVPQAEPAGAPIESSTEPTATEPPLVEVKAPSDATAELLAQIEALKAESQHNLDGWQRARAEFTNYKKRTERERVDASDHAISEVMKQVLPVIDDFERASENIPDELKDNSWVDGTLAVARKLRKLLEKYEIELIDPVGEVFNPELHQAIGVDAESEFESGLVSQTLQKGYIRGDKVLRAAIVRVAE